MYAYLKKYRFNTHIIKQFLIYSFGSFFLRIVSMLVVPLTLRKLLPADFGTLALITSFIAIANAIIGLGLRQVLSIEYFHCNDRNSQITLINDIIIIYTASAIPIVIILFGLHHFFLSYIFFNTITKPLYVLLLLMIFFSFYTELLYQLMQYNHLAYQLTLLQIVIALINSSCTILSLWYFNMGISGVIVAQAIGIVCGLTASCSVYLKYIDSHLIEVKKSIKKTKQYVLYGLPFISTILFNWIMSSSDRWVLGYYTSMHQVGIYSTADLFAQLFNTLVLIPWSGSYLPYIMQKYKRNQHNLLPIEQENQNTMWKAMALCALLITCGTIFLYPLFKIVLPHVYHDAFKYIGFLLAGQLFLLGSYFCSSLIQFHKKKYFLAYAYAIPALLNIALNFALIPLFNIYGAVIATLTSYGLFFIVTLAYNKQLQKKDY